MDKHLLHKVYRIYPVAIVKKIKDQLVILENAIILKVHRTTRMQILKMRMIMKAVAKVIMLRAINGYYTLKEFEAENLIDIGNVG